MLTKSLAGMLLGCTLFQAAAMAQPASSLRAQPATPLRIGVMLCQTGACAETGRAALKGVELATEEINAKGGILGREVELVVQDTKEANSGGGSVSAFQALIKDPEVKLLVGPTWDVGGMPLVPLMMKRGDLLLISPSVGIPEFSAVALNIFNLSPIDEAGVKKLAQVAFDKGWSSAAILSGQDNWASTQAKTFQAHFEQLGGKVVSVQEPLPTQVDLKSELAKIVARKPDVVLLTMFAHLPTAVKQLRQLGFTGHFLSVQMDQARIAASGAAIEGTIFPKFEAPKEEFVSAFTTKYGTAPETFAATGYDAILLLSQAAKTCKGFSALCLRSTMRNSSFEGSSGQIHVNDLRMAAREPSLFVVQGMESVEVR